MRSWGELVASGELARTLTRLCVVVADRLALGYRLTPTGLEVAIDGVAHAIEPPADDRDVLGAVGNVLGQINEHLGDEQLLLVAARDAGYRIVLADPRQVPPEQIIGMSPRITRGELIERELAALPALAAPRIGEDGSLAGLVAAYVERLARFAGEEHVHCEPQWTQNPGALAFTLSWRPPDGGGAQVTLRVPLREGTNGPELDPRPILDVLNRFGDDDRDEHLYRIAADADRVDVVRLDRATAAELRRRGELVEHPAQDVLRVLADAGFELSWLGRDRTCHAYHQHELATRLAMLAASAGIALPARASRYEDAPLARVVADINAAISATEHRVAAVVGEPFFYGMRLVLLDRAWCAYLPLLARTGNLEPGCVAEAELAGFAQVSVVAAYPAVELPPAPPRLPALDELVRSENILEHDFKCSSRPSDLGELIDELARFARLAVEVGACSSAGDDFAFAVTCRGEHATVTLANEKYADVGPILDYVNARIGARTPRHQLYAFRSGTWGGGIVRATDDEAVKLRAAGYIA